MGLIDGILNVGKAAIRIGKVVVPMLRGLADMVPELGRLFGSVDDAIDQGGTVADDFFDRNLGVIGDVREFFVDLQAVGVKGQETCDAIVVASQVDTPDQTDSDGDALGDACDNLNAGPLRVRPVGQDAQELRLRPSGQSRYSARTDALYHRLQRRRDIHLGRLVERYYGNVRAFR